jgi:S-DNA-T family DNA segregation ATPase FtsK/SpoIIIE
MVICLIARQSPAQCRLLLIDPKMTEFAVYDGLPHLLAPVVDTQAGAAKALRWLLSETMERYKLFKKIRGARNLAEYNAALKLRGEDELPYLVAFVDEAADLITSTGEKNSEESKNAAAIKAALQKLAQIARAAGVHMVLSMQRPSADIIDGAIRANFLARMAFLAASRVDAGVMGIPGSERCLGKGDGLYREGGGETIRIHSGYVDIAEIITIVDGLCATESPEYVDMGGDDSEGDGESDTHVSTAAPAKRSLDEVLKEALESGMKSRTALFDIAKANGYRSEGSLSSSLKRIGAYADGKEGFQAAALYRLP